MWYFILKNIFTNHGKNRFNNNRLCWNKKYDTMYSFYVDE